MTTQPPNGANDASSNSRPDTVTYILSIIALSIACFAGGTTVGILLCLSNC